jgi:hypothetical protein
MIMVITRTLFFFICVGFINVTFLLTSELFSDNQNWFTSFIFGFGNAFAVSVISLLYRGFFRPRGHNPETGVFLSIFYILFGIGLFVWGLIGVVKEPLIWEGIGLWFFLSCPASYVLSLIPWPDIGARIFLVVLIPFGAFYYFVLGNFVFDKFVFATKPRARHESGDRQ